VADQQNPDVAGPCDLWTGDLNTQGYGWRRVYVPGFGPLRVLVHREAWEAANGPVPPGLELDHLCRVKACRAVAHLEAVTHQENVERAQAYRVNYRPDACPRGHLFTLENSLTYHRPGRQTADRACRICENARGAIRRAANRKAAASV